MTRTVRIELADVAAWPNLEAALWSAAQGKRQRRDVAAFLDAAPQRLEAVRLALLDARLPDRRLRAFAIRDPKPRLIHAAPFADRVAHHALMRLLEPRLEKALVPTSYACRPGRGVHVALEDALAQCRHHPWYLQLDVRHCFPNIPHDRLLALLARRLKGGALRLVEHIVRAHESMPGRGLPIGALTSQHFANQYLGELDRHAIAQPECRAHLRYMDDVVLWCDSGEAACALRDRLMAWLPEALGLDFKPPVVQRSGRGLSLCGMRVWPSGLRLGPRLQRAWRRVAREIDGAQAAGADERWLQQRAEVLRGLSLPTRRRGWQRAVLLRCPSAALPQEESESPAGASRRELDQQRQELPFRQPQRERAG